jgi:hypothetical protein
MNVTLAYKGHSAVTGTANHQTLRLVPNLARDPVAFDGPLKHPLRFREAMSALHDTVISDLRFKKKDKTAYRQWKANEAKGLNEARRRAVAQLTADALAKQAAVSPDLQKSYDRAREKYWDARVSYDKYLRLHDAELWRMLLPWDPVITVADDVVFFECFSADESSYGCLTVDRADGFGATSNTQYGTTNVDYSWTSTTTSSPSAPTAKPASASTPKGFPSPPPAPTITAKRRSTSPTAGSAAS